MNIARQRSEWTPARVFLLLSALFHVPVALIGFAYDRSFPIGSGAAARTPSAHVFGVFETNGWHTLGAAIVGAISLFYVVRPRDARAAALALGTSHVGLWLSLAIWEPSTFWIASNTTDQIVHASTAVGGILSALLTTRVARLAPSSAAT